MYCSPPGRSALLMLSPVRAAPWLSPGIDRERWRVWQEYVEWNKDGERGLRAINAYVLLQMTSAPWIQSRGVKHDRRSWKGRRSSQVEKCAGVVTLPGGEFHTAG